MRWRRKRRGRCPGAPQGAPRCFFGGVCTCRAGPMCPAAGYAFFGGARGPRPTGRYVEPRVGDGVLQWSAAEQMPLGYDVPSARRCRAVIPRRVATRQSVFLFLGRRIPTPVTAGHTGPALQGAAVIQGGQSRPPLQTRNDRKHRRAARHARRVRSFIYWSRGGIYRATMWRRKLVSGDLRAGAGTGHPDRRRVSGGVPDVSGGVSADRLRRGVLA